MAAKKWSAPSNDDAGPATAQLGRIHPFDAQPLVPAGGAGDKDERALGHAQLLGQQA